MRTTPIGHLESEIALVITNNSQAISQQFARMKSILQYDLRPRPVQRINDTYYDTPSGRLRSRRIILRVRRIDHIRLITLKLNPRKLRGKGIARIEIELPWSRSSLIEVVNRLRIRGRADTRPRFSVSSPSTVLDWYGLHPIQERRTVRKVRDVFSKEKQDLKLAELAIDSTTFLLRKTRVQMNEIEIEAKTIGSIRTVQRIAGAIVEREKSVRYWVHGKFVTGLAIQNLLERGELQPHLIHKMLGKGAFPLIDGAIRSRRL